MTPAQEIFAIDDTTALVTVLSRRLESPFPDASTSGEARVLAQVSMAYRFGDQRIPDGTSALFAYATVLRAALRECAVWSERRPEGTAPFRGVRIACSPDGFTDPCDIVEQDNELGIAIYAFEPADWPGHPGFGMTAIVTVDDDSSGER